MSNIGRCQWGDSHGSLRSLSLMQNVAEPLSFPLAFRVITKSKWPLQANYVSMTCQMKYVCEQLIQLSNGKADMTCRYSLICSHLSPPKPYCPLSSFRDTSTLSSSVSYTIAFFLLQHCPNINSSWKYITLPSGTLTLLSSARIWAQTD